MNNNNRILVLALISAASMCDSFDISLGEILTQIVRLSTILGELMQDILFMDCCISVFFWLARAISRIRMSISRRLLVNGVSTYVFYSLTDEHSFKRIFTDILGKGIEPRDLNRVKFIREIAIPNATQIERAVSLARKPEGAIVVLTRELLNDFNIELKGTFSADSNANNNGAQMNLPNATNGKISTIFFFQFFTSSIRHDFNRFRFCFKFFRYR